MKIRDYLNEATITHGYPDTGGIAGDDDAPTGNILMGRKYKKVTVKTPGGSYQMSVPDDKWTWDEFENAGGMEDYDNYHQTLQGMKPLFSDETWKNVWKRMRQVPDKETEKEFDKAGQPWRTGDTQLGKDKADVALPPKEIQAEELIKRIDKLIL